MLLSTSSQSFSAPLTRVLFVFLLVAGTVGSRLKAQEGGVQLRLAAAGGKGANVINSVTVRKRRYLYLRQIAAYYRLNYSVRGGKAPRRIVLSDSRQVPILEFNENSVAMTFNGTAAALCFPVTVHKGQFMLEYTDFTEFVDPMVRPWRVPRRLVRTVMLDAGHGGSDQGAEGGGIKEKNLNLAMVRRVGAILSKRGYRVVYTRRGDATLPLASRSIAAGKVKPALFLSIHCNSSTLKNISGIEVFIANPAGVPSYGTDTLGVKAPGTAYNRINALWAYYTQRELIRATKAVDRGIKRKQFYVIRETAAPSMLVEIGFLSNEAERRKLLQSDYQDKIAVALCDAVDKLAKSVRPPVKPASTAPPTRR